MIRIRWGELNSVTSTALPIYYQIKKIIKNWIINKEFDPGDRIPSEHEIANRFGVSRLTVRQAIAQLHQEGFLISRRGEGTFVTDNENLINSFDLEFTGFMDDLFYQIQKSVTKSVEIARTQAPRSIRDKLELQEENAEIVNVKRVRFKQEKSFAFTENFIPLEIGRSITEQELYRRPMLEIFEQDLGIQFTEAFQTIEASFAQQEVAEKLGILPGAPILFAERIMYGKKRKPIEVVQSSYRGDLYKYIVRLKNIKKKSTSIWMHQIEWDKYWEIHI